MNKTADKIPKIALMSYSMDNRVGKGTAIYTRHLIEEFLKDKRFDWYLVHYDKVSDVLYSEAKEIIMPKIKLPYGTRFFRQLLFFWKYRNDKFDIIHWFQPRLYPFFWLAPAKNIIVTAHGAADITAKTFFSFPREVMNFLMVHFNRHIRTIIAASEFGRREIIEFYKSPSDKVVTIYDSGSEDFTIIPKDEARKVVAKSFGITEPFIFDTSRLEGHKNIDTLIKAYNIFRDSSDKKHKLVIAGSKGLGYEKIYELADSSSYKEDIVFLGYISHDELNACYSAAELFVFPSLNEGFGLPVLEAMSSGVPVLTSNVTALPEVAGVAAVLVDPTDEKAIAREINRILSDENLKRDMVRKGFARAREFSWSKTAEKTIGVYLNALNIR